MKGRCYFIFGFFFQGENAEQRSNLRDIDSTVAKVIIIYYDRK